MYDYALPARKKIICLFFSIALLTLTASAQTPEELAAKAKKDKENAEKAKPTEVYSPVPQIVTPGKTDAEPPSDAIVLFDGKNLDLWRAEGPDTTRAAGWKVHDDIVTVDKKAKASHPSKIYGLPTAYRIPNSRKHHR